MPKRKPIPTHLDFQSAVLEVMRQWSMMDVMDPGFLRQQAHDSIMRRFPRRMKQREIYPRVFMAILCLLKDGRLRRVTVADDYPHHLYGLVIDRQDVMDLPNLDQ